MYRNLSKTLLTVLVAITVSSLALFWSDKQFDKGYDHGVSDGRRELIETILLNASQGEQVVITQGENIVVLNVEKQ